MSYLETFTGQEEPSYYCEEGESCYYNEDFQAGYTFGIFIALIIAYFSMRGHDDKKNL